MKAYVLQRTGDRPLRFVGELVATATSRSFSGPCESRWYELALYRTESGRYVVSIGYRSLWQGELAEDHVYVEDTPASVAEALRSMTPEMPLSAFPPGSKYDEKRTHVARSLRLCYETAVSELLKDIEPEEL